MGQVSERASERASEWVSESVSQWVSGVQNWNLNYNVPANKDTGQWSNLIPNTLSYAKLWVSFSCSGTGVDNLSPKSSGLSRFGVPLSLGLRITSMLSSACNSTHLLAPLVRSSRSRGGLTLTVTQKLVLNDLPGLLKDVLPEPWAAPNRAVPDLAVDGRVVPLEYKASPSTERRRPCNVGANFVDRPANDSAPDTVLRRARRELLGPDMAHSPTKEWLHLQQTNLLQHFALRQSSAPDAA